MSLFGGFHVPTDEFIFHETFQAEPEIVIEMNESLRPTSF